MELFWLFDNKLDEIELDTYEQQNKFSTEDTIKHILGKFYDSLIDEIYNEILNKCEKLKQSKEIITMDKVLNMINSYEEDKIKITQNKLLKELLEDKICTDIVTKSEIVYDINDDMVFGLAGDIIELTEIDNSKNSNKNISTVNINLR